MSATAKIILSAAGVAVGIWLSLWGYKPGAIYDPAYLAGGVGVVIVAALFLVRAARDFLK